MPTVVLAGGSGFLGRSCADFLARSGYDIVVLSRRPAETRGRVRSVEWDGKTLGPWAAALEGADAAINFTGRSVACLYTPENRREILSSRLDSVNALSEAFQSLKNPPPVLIQAASLAIYGDTRALCDEDAPHGEGFSAEVCEAWERAFSESRPPGVRTATLRIGFALGPGGGALEPLAKLTRAFLGGSVGSGAQWISWLDLRDLNRLFLWAIRTPSAEGIFNATGPTPVQNRTFMRTLRRVLNRPWSPPAPEIAVRFGARYLLKADPSLALSGRRCVSRRLREQSFHFEHTNLEATLKSGLFA